MIMREEDKMDATVPRSMRNGFVFLCRANLREHRFPCWSVDSAGGWLVVFPRSDVLHRGLIAQSEE